METVNSDHGTVELDRLNAMKESQEAALLFAEREIRKLKKKFKSGRYDRQIVCEHILSAIRRRDELITSIGWISKDIEGKLSPAPS